MPFTHELPHASALLESSDDQSQIQIETLTRVRSSMSAAPLDDRQHQRRELPAQEKPKAGLLTRSEPHLAEALAVEEPS
jgi:hypothetical protein